MAQTTKETTAKKEQPIDLEAIKAQLKAELAAEFKAEKDAEIAAKNEEQAKKNAEMEEYVEIKLFKDNGKYKDDVYVSCNGENCVIQRGVRVKVKKKFAEILDHSEHQDYETSLLIEAEAQNAKNKANVLA